MSNNTGPSNTYQHRVLQKPVECAEDSPINGYQLPKADGPLDIPPLVFGCAVFSGQYNSDDHILSEEGARAIRLGLRYGINAFDTSRYYGPSEYVLGNILSALKDEFPRSSYQIVRPITLSTTFKQTESDNPQMTKCGRFGLNEFDYSPPRIRQCVLDSLERLQTSYLDAVYLHDIEFVATQVMPKKEGNHVTALDTEAAAYGLAKEDEAKVLGKGDRNVLDAFSELRKLKQEGIVRNIGISGYTLPTLLRIAILVHSTVPNEPVDMILTYSHLTLQNSTFNAFAPHFYERAKVKQLLAASPLSMGLLTPTPPSWHPAPETLRTAIADIVKIVPDLPNLALGYAARQAALKTPLVGGFSNLREVHECVRVWREVHEKKDSQERLQQEKSAIGILEKSQYLDWSWKSP